jgi:hypothetical protein
VAKDLKLDVLTTSDPKGLIEAAAGVDELAKKTDKLGTQMKETTADTAALDAALEATKLKVNELSRSFAETGDKSILKQISATKRYQSQLESIEKTLADTGSEAGKAGDDISEFGRLVTANLNDSQPAFVSLQKAITDTQTRIKSLRNDFKNNGHESVFGDLQKSEADLKSLIDFADKMAPGFASAFAKAGVKSGEDFTSAFGEAFSGISEYAVPIMIGAAVAASPLIAAAIGAAVTTGFGLGVVGVGALSLKNNPQVKAALSGLTSDISSTFSGTASPLVGPIVGGLNDLDAAINEVRPDLTKMFTAAAPAAKELLDGLAGAAKSAAPAFADAMVKAEPAVEALASSLPQLGAAVGSAVDQISKTPGLARDVSGAFQVLEGTIYAVGIGVRALGTIWDASGIPQSMEATFEVSQKLSTGLRFVTGQLSEGGTVAEGVGGEINTLNTALAANIADLQAQATAIDTVIAAQQKYTNELEANDNAVLAEHQALLSFHQELKRGTKAWDENTAAGIKQVGNLNSAEQAIMRVYDSQVALNGPTVKNTTAALNSAEALYKTAKAAGATKGELSTLKSDVDKLKSSLAGLKSKSFTITEYKKIVHTDSGAGFRAANEGMPAKASGGRYGPGPMLVGERGPEIVVPDGSGTVIPNNQISMGNAGTQAIRIEFASSSDQLVNAIIGAIRPVVRGRYGGNVTLALAGA